MTDTAHLFYDGDKSENIICIHKDRLLFLMKSSRTVISIYDGNAYGVRAAHIILEWKSAIIEIYFFKF